MPLVALRCDRDLSRERLASLAGVSPRTIYAIEVEGVRPQRATLHVLAEALGCAPVDLLPLNDERPAGTPGAVTTSRQQVARHAPG